MIRCPKCKMLNKLSNIHCGACGNRLVADQEDEGMYSGPNLGKPPVLNESPKAPEVSGAKTIMGMPKIVAKDLPQRAPEPAPTGSKTIMGMPKIVAKDLSQRAPEPAPTGSKTIMGMPRVMMPKPEGQPDRSRSIGKETIKGMPAIRVERNTSDRRIDSTPSGSDPDDRAQIQAPFETDPDDHAQLGFLSDTESLVEEKEPRKPSATLFGMRAAELHLAAAEARRLSGQAPSLEEPSTDSNSVTAVDQPADESDPLMFVDTADFEISTDPLSQDEPDPLIFGDTVEFEARIDSPPATDLDDPSISDTLQPGQEMAVAPRCSEQPAPKVHSVASLKGEGPGFLETAAMPVLKFSDKEDVEPTSLADLPFSADAFDDDLSGVADDAYAQATQLGMPSNPGLVEEESAWTSPPEEEAAYEQTQLGTPTTHLTSAAAEESWSSAPVEQDTAKSASGGFVVFEGTVEATPPWEEPAQQMQIPADPLKDGSSTVLPPILPTPPPPPAVDTLHPGDSPQPAQPPPPPMGAHPAEWAAAGGPRPSELPPPAPAPPSRPYTPWVPESVTNADQSAPGFQQLRAVTPDYATAVIAESDEFDHITPRQRGWLTTWKVTGLLGLVGIVASTFLPPSNSTWSHLETLGFWNDLAPLSVAGLMLIASIPKRFPRLLVFGIGAWAGAVGLGLFAEQGTEPFLLGGQLALDYGLVLTSCGLVLLAGMIGVGGTNDGHMA